MYMNEVGMNLEYDTSRFFFPRGREDEFVVIRIDDPEDNSCKKRPIAMTKKKLERILHWIQPKRFVDRLRNADFECWA